MKISKSTEIHIGKQKIKYNNLIVHFFANDEGTETIIEGIPYYPLPDGGILPIIRIEFETINGLHQEVRYDGKDGNKAK